VKGEFDDSRQIHNIIVGNYNGVPIYLKDVATIKDGMRDMDIEERINGEVGARMFVQKKAGGNTVKVAKRSSKGIANNTERPYRPILKLTLCSTLLNLSADR
jgi:hydrophobic/amphiphilic exporter-1 (mainly G- bacteria), HAE1 family